MVGTPRSYKNGKGKTENRLNLGSINCRDVSTHDDRAVGNEKRRSLWERRRNKTTNKKKKQLQEYEHYTSYKRQHNQATQSSSM